MSVDIKVKQEFKVVLTLSVEEAQALDALVGYGGEAFVNTFLPVFYKELGKHYMQPYEQGLKTLFDNIRSNIPQALHRIETAKKLFEK